MTKILSIKKNMKKYLPNILALTRWCFSLKVKYPEKNNAISVGMLKNNNFMYR